MSGQWHHLVVRFWNTSAHGHLQCLDDIKAAAEHPRGTACDTALQEGSSLIGVSPLRSDATHADIPWLARITIAVKL